VEQYAGHCPCCGGVTVAPVPTGMEAGSPFVSANFGARGGECLRLERMTPPQTNLGLSH
jgi:hypothetical protein